MISMIVCCFSSISASIIRSQCRRNWFTRSCSASDHAPAAAEKRPPTKGIAPPTTLNPPRRILPMGVVAGRLDLPGSLSEVIGGALAARPKTARIEMNPIAARKFGHGFRRLILTLRAKPQTRQQFTIPLQLLSPRIQCTQRLADEAIIEAAEFLGHAGKMRLDRSK